MSKAFLALLFIFSSLIPTAHAVEVPATFSFQGSGYGHGVGLSQMGARSMALAGQSSEQITKMLQLSKKMIPRSYESISVIYSLVQRFQLLQKVPSFRLFKVRQEMKAFSQYFL